MAISKGIDAQNIEIVPAENRQDFDPSTKTVYRVVDAWTTMFGSWEVGDYPPPYGIELWARQKYLLPYGDPRYYPGGGADHHIHGAVKRKDGTFTYNSSFLFWSDGYQRLFDPSYDSYANGDYHPASGWANLPMAPSSSFDPASGQGGPWCSCINGVLSDVVCGIGLPNRQHVSTFIVWQEEEVNPVDPVDPVPVDPQFPGIDLSDLKFMWSLSIMGIENKRQFERLERLRRSIFK